MGEYRIDESVLAKLHAEGRNDSEIAAELGCSPYRVLRKRRKLGLAANAHGRPRRRFEDAEETEKAG